VHKLDIFLLKSVSRKANKDHPNKQSITIIHNLSYGSELKFVNMTFTRTDTRSEAFLAAKVEKKTSWAIS
jgi:hypothetical protein